MSSNGRSLLFLLQRCVTVRKVTLSTGIKTRNDVLSGICGFTQQRTWTSATRAVCQLQSAVKSAQRSFCDKAGAPSEHNYPPLPAYQPDSEPEKKEAYIVQVRGLPWSCSAEDLLQFFSDCKICDGVKGIHLTVDRQGRLTGRAFIEMEDEEDVSKALDKHRQYLGPRYVEVYEVTNADADKILKKATEAPGADNVVRLRGLPFNCTETDIAKFFSGLDIVENGITIVSDDRRRNTGQAYVQFSSKEATEEALQRDREVIGNRYIEVFPSRNDEIHSSRRRRSSAPPDTAHHLANTRTPLQPSPRHRSLGGSGQLLHYIHMRGIPFLASGEDIVKFFYPLAVDKILIECGPSGRPNGEADVYFSSHQDAVAAMSKDGKYIGERYIELFLNSDCVSDER